MSKKTIVYLSLLILATALFAGWSIEFGFGPIVVTPNTQPVYPGYPYPYPYPYPTPTPTPAGGIRVGISSVDNNGNGVLVTQVLQGYPAYGQLFPGDIIRSVQIIQGRHGLQQLCASLQFLRISTDSERNLGLFFLHSR